LTGTNGSETPAQQPLPAAPRHHPPKRLNFTRNEGVPGSSPGVRLTLFARRLHVPDHSAHLAMGTTIQ
jgi:hypothetical protein